MVSALKTMFARPALRRLAGPRSFERGLHYAWDRRTKKLRVEDEEVTAVVRGTHDYRVRLWIEEGGPAFKCTCPIGDAGNFCKHCVAVGLVLADEQAELYSDRAPTTADLRAYLRTRDKDGPSPTRTGWYGKSHRSESGGAAAPSAHRPMRGI